MYPEKMKMMFGSIACFSVQDKGQETWGLCGFEDQCPAGWKIALSEFLKTPYDNCDANGHNDLNQKLYIQPMFVEA